MAGLVIPGSMILGPSGGSSITTLPDYLASIGKNSWYARFVAGTNMYVNSDKTGGAVSLDGLVGSWDYDSPNSSNWSAYWTQATSGDRPYYKTAAGVGSLYAPGNNPLVDGTSRHMQLSSSTALNGEYSVIIKVPLLERDSRAFYSHNGTQFSISSSGGSAQLIAVSVAASSVADQITHCTKNAAGTASGKLVVGASKPGTGHNGFAPYVHRRTSLYSASAISEIWFIPLLGSDELCVATSLVT